MFGSPPREPLVLVTSEPRNKSWVHRYPNQLFSLVSLPNSFSNSFFLSTYFSLSLSTSLYLSVHLSLFLSLPLPVCLSPPSNSFSTSLFFFFFLFFLFLSLSFDYLFRSSTITFIPHTFPPLPIFYVPHFFLSSISVSTIINYCQQNFIGSLDLWSSNSQD